MDSGAMNTEMRSGDVGTIVTHCAVFGRKVTPVRKFCVDEVRARPQYPCSVYVFFTAPRRRVQQAFLIVPDNLTYLTVEVDGREVYDSRIDVPCDMTKWKEVYDRFEKKR